MEDPFNLAPPVFQINQKDNRQKPPKRWGWFAGVSAVVLSVAAIISIGLSRQQISADTTSYDYSVKISFTNVTSDIKNGDNFSAAVQVTNGGTSSISDGYLLVSATGADVASTIKLSDLQEGESGFLRSLTDSEKKKFDTTSAKGFYWYVGDLNAKQTKSQQIVGTATGINIKIEAKMFSAQIVKSPCGFLNLATCEEQASSQQIGYEATSITAEEVAKISLRSGYNFITLPYILTPVDAKNMLNSLKDRYAYYYDPQSAGYLNLYQDESVNYIKPGYGFWLYSSTDQEVELPSNKSETNSNDNYTVNLSIGWNHLGNPFIKRIIVSADEILVSELSDDGTATGVTYSLKSAVDAGVISQPYVVKSKNFTDSSGVQSDLTKILEWKTLGYGSTLDPFVGFLIKSEKKVAITFPGKDIVAPGDALTDAEKSLISNWIEENGLNEYGDPSGTVYSGGAPLDSNGNTVNRYDYILQKNPSRPWNN